MLKTLKRIALLLICTCCSACNTAAPVDKAKPLHKIKSGKENTLKVGASRFEVYLPLLEGKKVAVIANATSMVDDRHLIDALLRRDVEIVKVFAPEHGFRGEQDAGEKVNDTADKETGLPIISLYGANKKPSIKSMQDVDIMVFDIQDVGVKFYTYLSTLHYVMEACAETSTPLILLDRPNPNGFYIDGPVLKPGFESFVGLHPVPLVYGMTIGEYAKMINGEGWLKNGVKCNLTVVKISGYTHDTLYELPLKPSPNLPNMTSIYLYPSLALFEGTVISVGRGTDYPFQVLGHPEYKKGNFQFTPLPNAGAKNPKLSGKLSQGVDLRGFGLGQLQRKKQLSLYWLHSFYETAPDKENFFLKNNFFNKLAGNDLLMQQIKEGQSLGAIRASWQADLKSFRRIRERYLLYN